MLRSHSDRGMKEQWKKGGGEGCETLTGASSMGLGKPKRW